MKYFCSVVTIVGSLLGVLVLLIAFVAGESGPQQGAMAAFAIALAAIPYCLTRAIYMLEDDGNKNVLSGIQHVLYEIRNVLTDGQEGASANSGTHQATITHPAAVRAGRQTITYPGKTQNTRSQGEAANSAPKKCPHCSSVNEASAVICKFCGESMSSVAGIKPTISLSG